jgi:hypothetical protein
MRRAFEAQAKAPLVRAALRYACQRAALVQRVGGRVDGLYARELVQDALTDTWMGALRWDPERCSLLDHLRGAIRSRTWKQVVGTARAPHLSLDHGGREAADAEIARRHATTGNLSPILLASLARRVVTELGRLAEGDPPARLILDAWAEGLVDRDEVLAQTKLSVREYRAARARLAYAVQSLPRSVRDAAMSVLRSAS